MKNYNNLYIMKNYNTLSKYIDEKYIIYKILDMKIEYENIELYNKLIKKYKNLSCASLQSKHIMNINFIKYKLDNINFDYLSRNKYLNDEIIIEFQEYFDWKLLSLIYPISDNLLEKYPSLIDITLIKINNISEKNIEKYKNVLNWGYFCLSSKIIKRKNIKILEKYKNTELLDWEFLSRNRYINNNIINKFKNYLNWDVLSKWYNFEYKMLKKYKKIINWEILSKYNTNINIKEYKDCIKYLNIGMVIRNNLYNYKEIEKYLKKEDLIYIYQHNNTIDEEERFKILMKINE